MPFGLMPQGPQEEMSLPPEQMGPPADMAPPPEMPMPQGGGDFFNQPDPAAMQAMQQRPQPQQTSGGIVAPTDFLDSAQKTLYGEYLALHGQGAAVKLQELDKAAKFRRALSMIQETFATITGRPDIAASVRANMVKEDHERAQQVESQILAKVGMAAIDREQRMERQKDEVLNIKLQAAEQKMVVGQLKNAEKAAREDIRNRVESKDGKPPDFEQLVEAKYRMFNGDSSFQAEYDRKWPVDELRAIQNRAAAKTTGENTGAARDAKAGTAGAVAEATEPSKGRLIEKQAGAIGAQQRETKATPGAAPLPKPEAPEQGKTGTVRPVINRSEKMEPLDRAQYIAEYARGLKGGNVPLTGADKAELKTEIMARLADVKSAIAAADAVLKSTKASDAEKAAAKASKANAQRVLALLE